MNFCEELFRARLENTLNFAQLGPVAGVDEAGRGACAGPLVVAACILPQQNADNFSILNQLQDSKKISQKRREVLAEAIKNIAVSYSVVVICAQELDAYGLHAQNLMGMRSAVYLLEPLPGYVLLDGYRITGLPCPSLAIIHGDDAALCISAASIIAKVTRDNIMRDYDVQYPHYGFAQHKGYGTAAHHSVLERLGPSPIHRLSYANVKVRLANTSV